MSAAEEVAITGFDLIVRGEGDLDNGVAPRRFYLVTSDQIVEVTMPEDAWKKPAGTRYRVRLNEPIHTSCIALVLGEAFAAGRGPEARVTLAEVQATTDFDGMSLAALVAALSSDGARGVAAAALLQRASAPAFEATAAGYDTLDEKGKRLASSVLDAATCREQVPFFGAIFARRAEHAVRVGDERADSDMMHAQDRLRRCGQESAGVLGNLVRFGANDQVKRIAAEELAVLAPGEAVAVLVDALAEATDDLRASLRASLSRAAKSPRAVRALADAMAATKLRSRPAFVAVDVLRAVGPSLGLVEGAEAALMSVATPSASFRARYLVIEPASLLAEAGNARAQAWLRDTLRHDPDPHVRAGAARAAGRVPSIFDDLVGATNDPDPRAREAAVVALSALAMAANHSGGASAPFPYNKWSDMAMALDRRVATDPWPFVREAAVRGLGVVARNTEVDRRLAFALDNEPARRACCGCRRLGYATRYGLRRGYPRAAERRRRGDRSAGSCDSCACSAVRHEVRRRLDPAATGIRVPIDEGERRLQSASSQPSHKPIPQTWPCGSSRCSKRNTSAHP